MVQRLARPNLSGRIGCFTMVQSISDCPFQIARRFAHKKAREEIRAFPEFWKEVGQGYRRKLIERYPFGIIYPIVGDEIQIVALAHTSRKPGYWKGR
jgi:hypothetical protein